MYIQKRQQNDKPYMEYSCVATILLTAGTHRFTDSLFDILKKNENKIQQKDI